MKKLICFVITLIIAMSCVFCVSAEDANVTYDGGAKDFIFLPGSEESLTDLFPNFKDVMPGDSLAQKITVKNDASNKVKVKIYMRSLGAQPESAEFLSQLGLKVQKTVDNEMGYMFDAKASETAQLTDWVELGTLYSGGTVDLNVILDVPVTLDNNFKNHVGKLDWEFKIEEFPIEESDPEPPKTGDNTKVLLWFTVMLVSAAGMIVLLIYRKKEQKSKK